MSEQEKRRGRRPDPNKMKKFEIHLYIPENDAEQMKDKIKRLYGDNMPMSTLILSLIREWNKS